MLVDRYRLYWLSLHVDIPNLHAHGVKFGGRDDFGELFHVGRLDINNVETLILNIEVPKIDPQIITADKGLSIAVH
ncbi:hypothetical protein HG530_012924 [Fusarium avenaceum]|nr:hypothetical protein HG530_012924 [Fusarium avenaceum]